MAKIMIVDDSKIVRDYHRDILETLEHTVAEAENGMEALEKSVMDAYDLYLVDINMPVMDGYSFVKEFRKREGGKEPFIIMISTEAEQEDMYTAFKEGANLYFVKPVRPDDMASVLGVLTA